MPQMELSCVKVLRFPRKFETVKPGVSAETAKSHCTGIGKLVIEIFPKGELEAFFLLLGGIYCSPLGTIKAAPPAQSHAFTAFLHPSCTRFQHFYGLAKHKNHTPTKGGCSKPLFCPHPRWVISALFLHKGIRAIPDWKWDPWGSLKEAQENKLIKTDRQKVCRCQCPK